LMAMLARGIVGGEMAWPLIVVGVLMGLALIMVEVRSPMLFAVGMYLPLETTFAIFCGGIIRWIMDKMRDRRDFNDAQKARVENAGILTASGFIAGEALMGIVIPNDFAKNLGLGKEAQVQVLLDGSDSNTASIALGYAQAVISTHSRNIQVSMQSLRAGSVIKGGVDSQVRVWYNPDLLSQNFIVPGLIAVILMVIAANLSSLCIAREWENGTMEQLLSTPVRPAELALGKLSAYFVVGMVDMLICLCVGLWGFGVPLKGSLVLLMVSSCTFLFGSLGLGIMISAANRTQIKAYQVSMLTSFLPAFLLSGFIYSITNMPLVIQFVALFVPARYFMEILRGVFLKGTGLEILWFDFLLLFVYGAMVFFFATRKLRQKVA